MSIRYIAQELYRLEREVEAVRRKLGDASAEVRDELELELRRTTAERDKYRAILESKKDPPPYRRTFR